MRRSGLRVVLLWTVAAGGSVVECSAAAHGPPADAAPADAVPANGEFTATAPTPAERKDFGPLDFAYGMPVVTAADGPAYRIALPPAVYQHAAREELADIRVFNASGEVVPYALSRPSDHEVPRGPGTALPLFPLRSDSAAASDAVRVTIDSSGTDVKLQSRGSGPATGRVKQYILDGRPLEVPLAALQLNWPNASADFTGRARVEASDDFATWRTLADSAPIANLHAGGQQLVDNRIELPATRAKYWRLSWIGTIPPFELTSVIAEPADSRVEAPRSTLEITASPKDTARGEYEFYLVTRLPIERVNLILPERNTVVAVQLLSRMRPQDPWRRVAGAEFYRVNNGDAELHNDPIDIATDADRYWLARMSAPNGVGAAQPLRLQVAWRPAELTFLARGAGPYLLAYGSSIAPDAESNLRSIPASVAVLPASLGDERVLGGRSRLIEPPTAFPWKRVSLWTVLTLCVVVLAVMAYRLSKEMNRNA
jgi:hypothetical protein